MDLQMDPDKSRVDNYRLIPHESQENGGQATLSALAFAGFAAQGAQSAQIVMQVLHEAPKVSNAVAVALSEKSPATVAVGFTVTAWVDCRPRHTCTRWSGDRVGVYYQANCICAFAGRSN
jgi:hypothetical protein